MQHETDPPDRLLVYATYQRESLEYSIRLLLDGIAQQGDFWVPVHDRMASEVLPIIGTAIDRLLIDRLFVTLYPEEFNAMVKTARAGQKRRAENMWWMPGKTTPGQVPDFSPILGQM